MKWACQGAARAQVCAAGHLPRGERQVAGMACISSVLYHAKGSAHQHMAITTWHMAERPSARGLLPPTQDRLSAQVAWCVVLAPPRERVTGVG